MKSTSAEDRVKRNRTMDQFCAPSRGMLYNPVNTFEKIDAVLHLEKNDKITGLAKVISQPGKFGNKPTFEVEKELVDYLYELGLLIGKASAIICRFRDKSFYWRVESPDKLTFENSTKRGKSHTTYKIPINYLKPL